jgi:serine/threonine-protein kinase
LHRDLKPHNIVLEPYGETVVLDWGLAKLIGRPSPVDDSSTGEEVVDFLPRDADEVTFEGALIGTPGYMSPEQARGRHDEIGPRSDVYTLGATLYSILTGKAPFEGLELMEVLERVLTGNFLPPHEVNPRVTPALEAICLKAMAHYPEDRYASASALADDVERWLADEPVVAYPAPFVVRLGRWARRRRTAIAASMTLLVSATLALGLFVSVIQIERARLAEAVRRASALDVAAERLRGQAAATSAELDRQRRLTEATSAELDRQRRLTEQLWTILESL